MPQRQQMFLERRSYRQRRMMDALRLLPVLGLCLCMVPLLWPLPNDQTSPQAGMPMSAAQAAPVIHLALIELHALLRARTATSPAPGLTAPQPEIAAAVTDLSQPGASAPARAPITEPAHGWFSVAILEIKLTLDPLAQQFGSPTIQQIFSDFYDISDMVDLEGYFSGIAARTRMVRAWSDSILASTTSTAIRKIESILPENLKKEIALHFRKVERFCFCVRRGQLPQMTKGQFCFVMRRWTVHMNVGTSETAFSH